jgi:hypothetical protein
MAAYGHADKSDLLSFNCSSITCIFNCVQRRCLSTAGVVASLCFPTVNPRSGMSPGTWDHEDQCHIIELDVKPLYHRVVYV